jgi:hypothetical protein
LAKLNEKVTVYATKHSVNDVKFSDVDFEFEGLDDNLRRRKIENILYLNHHVLKDVKRYVHSRFTDEDSLSKYYRNMKQFIFQATKMEEVQ